MLTEVKQQLPRWTRHICSALVLVMPALLDNSQLLILLKYMLGTQWLAQTTTPQPAPKYKPTLPKHTQWHTLALMKVLPLPNDTEPNPFPKWWLLLMTHNAESLMSHLDSFTGVDAICDVEVHKVCGQVHCTGQAVHHLHAVQAQLHVGKHLGTRSRGNTWG